MRKRRAKMLAVNLALQVLEQSCRKPLESSRKSVRLALRVLHPHVRNAELLPQIWEHAITKREDIGPHPYPPGDNPHAARDRQDLLTVERLTPAEESETPPVGNRRRSVRHPFWLSFVYAATARCQLEGKLFRPACALRKKSAPPFNGAPEGFITPAKLHTLRQRHKRTFLKFDAIPMQHCLGVVPNNLPGPVTFTALFARFGAKADIAQELGLPVALHFRTHGILDAPLRLIHFIGQCGHESGSFATWRRSPVGWRTRAAPISATRSPAMVSATSGMGLSS
ncbi:hypothetical protein [Sphingomonas sp. Mn802worker]|uniref:hypothetical protein n=1 Tax=Sphingomonas sp. Mn802worker TaxID=629773 RepID=UPI001872F569|nr:hypothetical protein [Sphingomonas sp. Mn802worker]